MILSFSLCLSVCLSLSLCLSVSMSVSLSLSLSLSILSIPHPTPSLSLSFVSLIPLFLSLPFLSLHLLSLRPEVTLYGWRIFKIQELTLSVCLCLFICPSVCLSVCLCVSACLSVSLTLHNPTKLDFPCPSFPESLVVFLLHSLSRVSCFVPSRYILPSPLQYRS